MKTMTSSLSKQLFPNLKTSKWIHHHLLLLFRPLTSSQNQEKPSTHLLKPLLNPTHITQILTQIIVQNLPMDHFSLIKLIDSYGFASSASFFSQFHHLIDSQVCNSVVLSYTHLKKHWHSVFVFVQMQRHGISPDSLTFPAVIKSAGLLCRRRVGKSLHCCVIKVGFGFDMYINTSLVHMYCCCAGVDDAHQMFDEMPERNSVSWNALIAGYLHNRRFMEAIGMFKGMLRDGGESGEVTMVVVLSACANLGAHAQGKWVHDYVIRNRLALNVYLGTALIDMYAKCGELEKGCEVFGAMGVKNVCTWNVMIAAYVMNGREEEALTTFYTMIFDDYMPDDVTFLAVLSACFQRGLVEEGLSHFRSMKEEFGLEPKIAHYSSMVDLLWFNGYVNEAIELIRTMPLKPDPTIWRALLRASYIQRNCYLAELALLNLIKLEPNNGDNFFLLSNLYTQQQRWDEVGELRETMNTRGIQKIPGYSSIEIDTVVYEFVVSCDLEPGLEEVYKLLANIDKELRPANCVGDMELL